jgi:hypothetical protein
MNSSKPSFHMDRKPLKWRMVKDTTEGGYEVDCLTPDRPVSGFEAIAINHWCTENVGSEGIQWGRTIGYGWWFVDPARHTQFLLVFQSSKPEIPAGTQVRFMDNQPESFVMWNYIKPQVDN